ncbi:hypothetical protein CDL15_Pgr001229 [Punica granatum]|nr:hypothetical protein CDL15_Pgr001229 [Punica granatum]
MIGESLCDNQMGGETTTIRTLLKTGRKRWRAVATSGTPSNTVTIVDRRAEMSKTPRRSDHSLRDDPIFEELRA